MSTLHTVNKSPFQTSTLVSCLKHAKDGDGILLIEDAVYGTLKDTSAAGDVSPQQGRVAIYALGPDLAARGLAEANLIDGIEVVDYGGFVDLVCKYDVTHSWL